MFTIQSSSQGFSAVKHLPCHLSPSCGNRDMAYKPLVVLSVKSVDDQEYSVLLPVSCMQCNLFSMFVKDVPLTSFAFKSLCNHLNI